jgi:hypothetical protein
VRDGTGYVSGYYTQPEEKEFDPNGQSKDMAVAFPKAVGVRNAYPSSDWLKGYIHIWRYPLNVSLFKLVLQDRWRQLTLKR